MTDVTETAAVGQTSRAPKAVSRIFSSSDAHWVGDGFPVRSLFSYHRDAAEVTPFLLLDFAGPYQFEPGNVAAPRGVGEHPHRGFETVTMVYDGEVSHKDSHGGGGTIGAGEVQWMTAASGVVHQEYHSEAFTKSGGPFRMIQLWVNLPAKDKMNAPGYQALTRDNIKEVALPDDAGTARIIAGDFEGTVGPAKTHTPINMWDVRLTGKAPATFNLPEGHTAMVVVVEGQVRVNGGEVAGEADVIMLDPEGESISVATLGDEAIILILTGEPIQEAIAGYGPFVMNTEAEIRQAIDDFNSGKFGRIAA